MAVQIHRFLIDNATAETIAPLLHPDGACLRFYNHWPTPEVAWWKASVPLSKGGENRSVLIQSLGYDLEISRTEFLDWIDEFRRGGMTLLQSADPLPYDLHPRRFRSSEAFEQVLKQLGAMLLFELPHSNETAGLTVFSDEIADWVADQGVPLRPDR